ncbi:MAG: DUF309 domain-containing protein [Defluviitaleaceae bacterium]|nr:DUF309 domain-containing protein [Defluviitaleaceae bacterium]
MYDKALIDFLIEFHSKRDYFECHEILEKRWMKDKERQLYFTALIQIAVGMYHYRRGNFDGSSKLFNKALSKIKTEPEKYEEIGFFTNQLIDLVELKIEETKEKKPYKSINLPMKENLIDECKKHCDKEGINFFNNSNMEDDFILNRHLPKYR